MNFPKEPYDKLGLLSRPATISDEINIEQNIVQFIGVPLYKRLVCSGGKY